MYFNSLVFKVKTHIVFIFKRNIKPEKSHKSIYGKTVIFHILLVNIVSIFLVESDFFSWRDEAYVRSGDRNVPKTVKVVKNVLFTIKLEI